MITPLLTGPVVVASAALPTPTKATANRDKIQIEFTASDGTSPRLEADHVIAATGYRPSLKRLAFLRPELTAKLRTSGEMPALSPRFESSAPGLYFVGPIAANSFGPLMRFACGAKLTAPLLGRHLAAGAMKQQMPRQTAKAL